MSSPEYHPDDGALERLADTAYRLALLSKGSPEAAEMTVLSDYRALPRAAGEDDLLRQLAPDHRATAAWKLTPTAEQAQRAALGEGQLQAIVQVLRTFTPTERFLLGLRILRAMSPAAVAGFAGPIDSAGLFARFHIATGRALGLLPADADETLLAQIDGWLDGALSSDEALELRRTLLADAGTGALRDSMATSRDALARAVASIAGTGAPPALLTRLAQQQSPARPARPRVPVGPALALVGVVVLVALAVVIGPALFRRGQPTTAAASDPAALVEAAMRRFEQPRQTSGVLHERYRVETPGEEPLVIERWYDYTAPNRLAIDITRANQQTEPLFRFATDGATLAQYRGERVRARDVELTAVDAAQLAPLFRSQPSPNALGTALFDVGRVYLGAARTATLTDLGQSVYQGRAATVVGYMLDTPLLPRDQSTPEQVLLTIDNATASLLEVAIIPRTEGEATAYFPLRSELFEVVADVSSDRFRFARSGNTIAASALGSLSASWFRSRDILSVEEAARRPSFFLPDYTPEPNMRGILGDMGRSTGATDAVGQIYEGEYSTLLILPGAILGDYNGDQAPLSEREGIQIRDVSELFGQPFISGALVEMQDTTRLLVVLTDTFAPASERQQKLNAVIDSLRPISPADVAAIEGWFAHTQPSRSE